MSDEVLDAVVVGEADENEMHISLNVLSGEDHPKTLRVRALVENQVILMLIDSGSSHSFVNASLVERIGYQPVQINTMVIKVANGEEMLCEKMITRMRWWVQVYIFQHDMKVLELEGYNAILEVDWLGKWGGGDEMSPVREVGRV